jgi:hypothetical protein
MRQWRAALPGRILEIGYEALVVDQEAATRQLLAFCGLDWNPACLAFERNAAPVVTASAVQVRAPLCHDAVARWKHYAEALAPLRELLPEPAPTSPRRDARAVNVAHTGRRTYSGRHRRWRTAPSRAQGMPCCSASSSNPCPAPTPISSAAGKPARRS